MYNFICKYCGTQFQLKTKDRKYCSRRCVCAKMSQEHIKEYREFVGKRFGRLVVVERECKDKRHPHLICNCDCGKQISVNAEQLLTGKTKSCGCMRIEKTFVEDTSLNTIRSKVRTDNTSGVKGVKKQKNKWIAYITFKKRHYNLGTFENKEEAIKARRDAEEKFFKPILKKYNII